MVSVPRIAPYDRQNVNPSIPKNVIESAHGRRCYHPKTQKVKNNDCFSIMVSCIITYISGNGVHPTASPGIWLMKTVIRHLVLQLVAAVCLLHPPISAVAQISDDFSRLEVDPAIWTHVDPANSSSCEALNGWLTIGLPSGTGHDIRQGLNRSARLVQAVSNVDFEIEAGFQSLPGEDYQAQGLIVEYDATHFLHLDLRRAGPDLKLSCATVTGGITKIRGEFNLDADGPVWLRLGRAENSWNGFYSLDGANWIEAFTFDYVMTALNVGVFAANAGTASGDSDLERDDPVGDKSLDGSPAPAFEMVVDYFFDTANPIDPEDGDIQNGVRVTDDLQALYFFNAGSGDIVFDYSTALPKLDLAIADTNATVWLQGGGLDLTAASLISSAGPAEKINNSCMASSEISMEAWVDPVTTIQSGPARILSVSADPSNRNATLAHGQWGSLPSDVFDARLRTTETSVNGQPETVSPAGSMTGDLQHVVYTRDVSGNARIYVDGVETVTEYIGGTLDNWDTSYRLGIGAEMDGTRFWLGSIHLAAVYSRALSARDVEINFGAGPDGGILGDSPPVITLHGLSPGQEFNLTEPVNLSAVAGDVDGFVTQAEFFAGDVLLAADTIAPFGFDWTNPAVGNHQIRAVATDDQGNQATSEVIPILVTVPVSYRSAWFLSDDFHDADLGQPWTVTDGTAGSSVSQSGGHVIVELPVVTQDPWSTGAQMFFAHQPEADGDIALELKLATSDTGGDVFGGLRFEGAGTETVQLLGENAGGNWTVSWGTSTGGTFTDMGSLAVPDVTDGLWLQVRRESGAWDCLYSTDGYLWQPAASLNRSMILERAGWIAGGLDSGNGPQTMAFDYAFNLADPIFPEDGGSGGDYTGPVISEVAVATTLDQASLTWQTDEPAFYRVAYGLTTGYEMGLLQGPAFLTDHAVDITGLDAGSHYHFKVTCVDTAGNFSSTDDLMIHTDLEPVLAVGPGAGDAYRETRMSIYAGDDWRVTDPDALNPGAAAFLPNPVLEIEVPDLTGAVRAEMIIDRWGGHPGTSNKMIRLAGRSWLHLPELATIPSSSPECYMYEDNLMLDIPLDQLVSGTVTLEGSADRQICNSFDWGQWGWYGVVVRVYYDGTAAHPTGSILSPAAGDTIVDAVDITVDAASTGAVEEVQVLAYYEGYDTDGDGVFAEWHRSFYRPKYASSVSIGGIVGAMTVAPYDINWDVDWIPDQQPGSVKLQARILDDSGMWYVTDLVEDLSLRHSDGIVKMHTMDNLPSAFWVRDGRSKSAEFTIPPEDDLATASSARMIVSTWNGSDTGKIDVNGLWQTTDIGTIHHYAVDELSLSVSDLIQGVNTLTISATTVDHGMEVLWPGPVFFVRYGLAGPAPATAATGDVDADGMVDQKDARLVLEHCVGTTRLSAAQAARGDLSGDGSLDPWDAALISGSAPEKSNPTKSTAAVVWGEAQGRYGRLTLPLNAAGGSAHSLWLEVTAPGIEDLVESVTTDLAEAGLFEWKASGDKLRVAFAGAEAVALPDRLLEIVMETSDGKSGTNLRAILAIDGGDALDLQDTDLASVPVRFSLGDNYPNPFNPVTKISFDLPASSRVMLRIYDVRGNEIHTLVSGVMPFGSHTVTWNGVDDRGRAVSSGVYFYRIEAEGFTATHKMMLLK